MRIKINNTNQSTNASNPKGPLLGVDGRIWRHTIGRVSNAVRVPINFVAAIAQGLKLIGKTAALPVTYTVVGIHKLITKNRDSYEGSMSLNGIAIDGIGFLGLCKNVGVCFKNAIVAPSIESHDFFKSMKGTLRVLKGDLQTAHQTSPGLFTVSYIFKKTLVEGKSPNSTPDGSK